MAEGVHVPTDAWLHSELLQQELVTDHHVVDNVLIMSARLIVHTPTRIHELESPLLHQLTYLVLECTSLVLPPHAEELHLDISESLVGISEQLIDHCVYDHVHVCLGYVLIRACVVLVYSLKPAYIVMSMGYKMDCYLSLTVLAP